jgi:hypothetical protein
MLLVVLVWLSMPTALIHADPASPESILRTSPACSRVQNMVGGTVAPCTGFLVPDAFMTQAIEYRRMADVLLPAAEERRAAEQSLCKQTCDAEKAVERANCEGRCSVMMDGCSGPSLWTLVGIGAGAAVVSAGATALVFLLR